MAEPHWIDVKGPNGDLRAFDLGPAGAPVALCLHRLSGYRLTVAQGCTPAGRVRWHVVALPMRGYAPPSIPADGVITSVR